MNRQAAGESFVTVSHSITTLMNNAEFYPSGIHFTIKEKMGEKENVSEWQDQVNSR